MNTNTTPAGKPATLTISFEPSAMATMDVGQRRALYDAFYLAGEVLHGVMLQPRCQQSNIGFLLNDAGAILDRMQSFFFECSEALVKAERARKDIRPGDNEQRLFMILGHEARMTDDLAVMAATASQYVVEQAECEWDARHGRKAVQA